MKGEKILLVTGRQASSSVEKYCRDSEIPVEIHVCDVDVASLLSPNMVLRELDGKNLGDISLILLPGAVVGDVSIIQEKTGVPCVRGSKNVGDLPFILEKISSGERLSMDKPADELFRDEVERRMEKEIEQARRLREGYTLRIGKRNPVYLGAGLMKIVAEIPDAPLLSEDELKERAIYYMKSGADIIDLGMISGVNNSDNVGQMVEIINSVVDIPTAIDSLDGDEILAGLDAGVDLILSIDETNYDVVEGVDAAVVVIPRNKRGIPSTAGERIEVLESMIQRLEDRGFNKIIVDPILSPPNLGLVESIVAYKEFRGRHPEIPLMFGAGNVTELMDADSLGVNALLTSIASELGVDMIFTTEASSKTRGVVRELSVAVKMMYLSKKRRQPPKDLGIDLLCLKDKRGFELIGNPAEESIEVIEVDKFREGGLEDARFRIYLSDKIDVIYYTGGKPKARFRGNRAKDVYCEILSRDIVQTLGHAAYLGGELEKAEIALKLGKNYVQDEDLF